MKTETEINTAEAFKALGIDLQILRNLARNPEGSDRLEFYGVEPSNFYPKVAEFISQDEWIKLLIYFEIEDDYEPARDKLIELGEI